MGKGKRSSSTSKLKHRNLIKAEGDDSKYAIVLKVLGGCRLKVICSDSIERIGTIKGSLQKKVWIGVKDTVLVCLSIGGGDKCDIVYKYTEDEVSQLKECREILDDMFDNNALEDEITISKEYL